MGQGGGEPAEASETFFLRELLNQCVVLLHRMDERIISPEEPTEFAALARDDIGGNRRRSRGVAGEAQMVRQDPDGAHHSCDKYPTGRSEEKC